MMRLYLDNNATTSLHPEVLESVTDCLRDVYGNASSIHEEGQRARRRYEEAREPVAGLIGASPREVVFTSGGTESNNAAIYGAMNRFDSPGHIVATTIEHPSVLEVIRDLERHGHEVSWIGCDERGVVSADQMVDAIRPDTRLIAMMLANNETGAIQPVATVGRHCNARGIHLHCDAVQGAGKILIDVEELHAGTLSLSAHKLHGPKGIGALYVRKGIALHAYIVGGSQERRRRAGTENVPLAIGFATAARIARDLEPMREVERRRDWLESQLAERLTVIVNGRGAPRLPNTSNLRFPGCDAEGLVIGLDLNGMAISTGSACSSGRLEPSRVLIEMGLSVEDAKSSVRISMSRFTTDEEIERARDLVIEQVARSGGVRAAMSGSRSDVH